MITPKKKPATSTPKSQPERFIETACELGADTDAEVPDRVFGKVVPPVMPKKAADERDDNQKADE